MARSPQTALRRAATFDSDAAACARCAAASPMPTTSAASFHRRRPPSRCEQSGKISCAGAPDRYHPVATCCPAFAARYNPRARVPHRLLLLRDEREQQQQQRHLLDVMKRRLAHRTRPVNSATSSQGLACSVTAIGAHICARTRSHPWAHGKLHTCVGNRQDLHRARAGFHHLRREIGQSRRQETKLFWNWSGSEAGVSPLGLKLADRTAAYTHILSR